MSFHFAASHVSVPCPPLWPASKIEGQRELERDKEKERETERETERKEMIQGEVGKSCDASQGLSVHRLWAVLGVPGPDAALAGASSADVVV